MIISILKIGIIIFYGFETTYLIRRSSSYVIKKSMVIIIS